MITKEFLESARKLLEVRTECNGHLCCSGCYLTDYCDERNVAEETNKTLEMLLDEAEKNNKN